MCLHCALYNILFFSCSFSRTSHLSENFLIVPKVTSYRYFINLSWKPKNIMQHYKVSYNISQHIYFPPLRLWKYLFPIILKLDLSPSHFSLHPDSHPGDRSNSPSLCNHHLTSLKYATSHKPHLVWSLSNIHCVRVAENIKVSFKENKFGMVKKIGKSWFWLPKMLF